MRSLALAFLLLLALGGGPAAATGSGGPGRIEFQLLRNGHPDGRHTVTVTRTAAGYDVASNVDIRVRAGPITLYRYTQACRESWSEARLSSLNCSTFKEGRNLTVAARRSDGALVVTGARGAASFPLTALPTSWWVKPPAFSGAMIDTQTGAPLNVRVEHLGREAFRVNGRVVQADHVRVTGTLTADLWYDEEGRWIGCTFTIHGQRFEYRIMSPIEAAPMSL